MTVVETTPPILLDLFCKAGGAAKGYQNAGFCVVGVDIEPQPHYCGDAFIQADALTFPLGGFDAIHASPPCQAYSSMRRATGNEHPDLIPETRARLQAAGVPWIIENVPGAPLVNPVLCCGPAYGLEVVRHRLFESNIGLETDGCQHVHGGTKTGLYVAFRHSNHQSPGRRTPPRMRESEFRDAMKCTWMTAREARHAIPPAYTEHLGRQLRAAL